MIYYIKGDLLSVTEGIIVHGCNCSGGFGSGIAGQIRKKWPEVYSTFQMMQQGEKSLGKVNYIYVKHSDEDEIEPIIVFNCFTQLNYGKDGQRYASVPAIRLALAKVFAHAEIFEQEINSPKIGCGLGGLSWENDVLPIFEELNTLYPDVDINIYEL